MANRGVNMKEVTEEDIENISETQKRIISEMKALSEDLRNAVLEEVAREIEKFTGFGEDTIASFTVYIRNMMK